MCLQLPAQALLAVVLVQDEGHGPPCELGSEVLVGEQAAGKVNAARAADFFHPVLEDPAAASRER